MELRYELTRLSEKIGDHRLDLECIKDLNQTIDHLFAWLEKNGTPHLLESLCPYFGVVWPAARALAERLTRIPGIAGTRVLEVGCGLAIPSLIAAKLGARVTAVDFHPEVPRFLAKNAELNGVTIDYENFDWLKSPPRTRAGWDWVIGSDILYEKEYPIPLARALCELSPERARILIADPGRPYLQNFVDAMRDRGFRSETEIVSEIFLLHFCRN